SATGSTASATAADDRLYQCTNECDDRREADSANCGYPLTVPQQYGLLRHVLCNLLQTFLQGVRTLIGIRHILCSGGTSNGGHGGRCLQCGSSSAGSLADVEPQVPEKLRNSALDSAAHLTL